MFIRRNKLEANRNSIDAMKNQDKYFQEKFGERKKKITQVQQEQKKMSRHNTNYAKMRVEDIMALDEE